MLILLDKSFVPMANWRFKVLKIFQTKQILQVHSSVDIFLSNESWPKMAHDVNHWFNNNCCFIKNHQSRFHSYFVCGHL